MTTVMLILQTVRNALAANNNVKKGLWTKDLPFSADTNGLVVGIIGKIYGFLRKENLSKQCMVTCVQGWVLLER